MKTEPNIPHGAHGGVYGDPDVVKAYKELYRAVHEFMDEVKNDSSYGALHIMGNASFCKSRAKSLTMKAKILEDIVKAACLGRK